MVTGYTHVRPRMQLWIALRPKSFWWRALQHSSNAHDLGDLAFHFKGRHMSVENDGSVVVESRGDSLRIDKLEFRNTYEKGRGEVLEGDKFRISYSPPNFDGTDCDVRHLVCSRDSTETYIVKRHRGLLTHCEIQAEASEPDQRLMVGLLAFFWTLEENERRRS